MSDQRTPAGLKAGGKRFWKSVTDEFELAPHELAILRECCRTIDALDELQKIIDKEGVTQASPQGTRAHPALVESRQSKVTLAKLVASLRIPLDDDQEIGRYAQQRSGVRSISGVA